ncbi:YSC84-related protein [Niveibacterium sp. SC-1]|uniref:YSC84-related protein n=1 Tax=Niveibacterium sp. SC-1 TaxID=3135646 RepID=UPI0031201EBB
MNSKSLALLAGLVLAAGFSQTVAAADPAAERTEIRKMCDGALATLYKAKPKLKSVVAKAPGYACFSSFGVTLIVGGAGGKGLVHDKAAGKDTYMAMAQASAGVELGIKDYREVIVFHKAEAMHKFIESGWEATATGGASAAADGSGGTAEKGGNLSDTMTFYPMTKTGLSAGGSLGGRKYWKDKDLNQ